MVGAQQAPAFATDQRAGLLDFLAVYEQVQETAMEVVMREPEWAPLVQDHTAEPLLDYARRARARTRQAIVDGDWQSYIEHVRSLGERYAKLGVSFAAWSSVLRLFEQRITPAIVAAYIASPERLTAALLATRSLLDFAISLITEQYVATTEQDRLRLLLDSVKDYAIYMLDASGEVTSWNAGAHAIFGYSTEQIIGQSHAVLFPVADRDAGNPGRVLAAAGSIGRFEEAAPRLRKDGTQVWAEAIVTAIHGAGNVLIGFANVVRDLTERKRLEAQLHEHTRQLEDSNRDLEAFSYSVAHDLRAPLRGMNGFAQILLEDHATQLDPDGIAYLNKIQANARRMGTLIDALLGLSRLSRGPLQLQPVDLSAAARGVAAQLAASEPDRTVDVTIEDGLRAVADSRLVRIVLENLIGNAWKFTGKVASPQIEFGTVQPATDPVSYFVRDNGAGFDMEHAAKLFTPFERLHTADGFPGAGIGLATVRRIVQRHGGTISVSAQLGGGATFTFTLAPPGNHTHAAERARPR